MTQTTQALVFFGLCLIAGVALAVLCASQHQWVRMTIALLATVGTIRILWKGAQLARAAKSNAPDIS